MTFQYPIPGARDWRALRDDLIDTRFGVEDERRARAAERDAWASQSTVRRPAPRPGGEGK